MQKLVLDLSSVRQYSYAIMKKSILALFLTAVFLAPTVAMAGEFEITPFLGYQFDVSAGLIIKVRGLIEAPHREPLAREVS